MRFGGKSAALWQPSSLEAFTRIGGAVDQATRRSLSSMPLMVHGHDVARAMCHGADHIAEAIEKRAND
nr:hypothetical protein [Streptomyces sp. S1D4-11]QIZ00824.1 hypothetical protein HEP87_52850 [Streptomyces sp. S1D4-11]